MADTLRDVMTSDPHCVSGDDSLVEAAKLMRDHDVGSVIVLDDDQVSGIVTDRDIAIRAVADGRNPGSTAVSEVATKDIETLSVDDSVDDAIRKMAESDIRRLPVVEDGRAAGIVSLGDLARERDPESVLADISSAPPDK